MKRVTRQSQTGTQCFVAQHVLAVIIQYHGLFHKCQLTLVRDVYLTQATFPLQFLLTEVRHSAIAVCALCA